jgi:hypothetical protein
VSRECAGERRLHSGSVERRKIQLRQRGAQKVHPRNQLLLFVPQIRQLDPPLVKRLRQRAPGALRALPTRGSISATNPALRMLIGRRPLGEFPDPRGKSMLPAAKMFELLLHPLALDLVPFSAWGEWAWFSF